MSFARRPRYEWRLRTRTLALGERTLLMGIVNVTPDSFSDGGQFLPVEKAVAHALAMLDAGADVLDFGGESTRPDATPITADEEQARVLPVLREVLRVRAEAVVSVDTYHAATALAAINAGAEIINDVSGLMWDAGMAAAVAEHRPGLVMMHTRGKPREWTSLPALVSGSVVPMVLNGLRGSMAVAEAAGVDRASVLLDPGFGFGKRGAENMELHAGLAALQELGRPLLVGTSRKRFLTAPLGSPTDTDRQHATTASNTAAILAGAHLLRVHDVVAARAAAAVADGILLSR